MSEETERHAMKMAKKKAARDKIMATKTDKKAPPYILKGIKEFSEYFGAKIDVKVSGNGKGKLIIPFSSEEDFKRLKKLIDSED